MQSELIDKVKSYANLHVGWDGESAQPLSAKTIEEGIQFIGMLDLSKHIPHVSPAGDGELSFSWRGETTYLEVGLFGEGVVYWYITDVENRFTENSIIANDDILIDVRWRRLLNNMNMNVLVDL